MATRHLPIFIENKRHVVVHLLDEEEKSVYNENRIFFCNCSKDEEIFSIGNRIFFPDESDDKISQACTLIIEYEKIKNNLCEMQLIVSTDPKVFYKGIESVNFNKATHYKLNFTYLDSINPQETITYSGCLYIIKTPKFNQFNIDLGSDSTQIIYKAYKMRSLENTKIINQFKKNYEGTRPYGDVKKNEFIQSDKYSEFYKTGKITLKKKLEKGETAQLKTTYNDEDAISFLFTNQHVRSDNSTASFISKENKYSVLLPNIKILLSMSNNHIEDVKIQDGDEPLSLGDHTAKIKVYTELYRVLVNLARDSAKGDMKGNPYLSIMLLMPNVYSQNTIDEVLYSLNNEFNRGFIEGHFNNAGDDHVLNNNDLAYDFRVVSESDAIYFGLNDPKSNLWEEIHEKNSTNSDEINDYIIIDSGKGTTDFSIVEKRMSTKATGVSVLYRGGIPLAGASIDREFFMIFANRFYKKLKEKCDEEEKKVVGCELFVKRMVDFYRNLDISNKTNFANIIEEMKLSLDYTANTFRDYSEPLFSSALIYVEHEGKKLKTSTKDLFFQMITNESNYKPDLIGFNFPDFKVEEHSNLEADELCGIEKCCETICSKICKNIPERFFNSKTAIVLTGRNFLFEPMRKELDKKVRTEEKKKSETETNNLKKIFGLVFGKHKKSVEKLKSPVVFEISNIDTDIGNEKRLKTLAVNFSDPDKLKINMYSNLCNLNIQNHKIGEDSSYEITKESFIKGIKLDNGGDYENEDRCYYIGYPDVPFLPSRLDAMNLSNKDYEVYAKQTVFPECE